mmetsp:Transcript_103477/g.309142  ORF Transcript_103477/g.309142 Transcript_103477/m.309142 type:complete len:267 (-) Transcript_103477:580-1380(-)
MASTCTGSPCSVPSKSVSQLSDASMPPPASLGRRWGAASSWRSRTAARAARSSKAAASTESSPPKFCRDFRCSRAARLWYAPALLGASLSSLARRGGSATGASLLLSTYVAYIWQTGLEVPSRRSSADAQQPTSIDVRQTHVTSARNSTALPAYEGARKFTVSVEAQAIGSRVCLAAAMEAVHSIHCMIQPPKVVPMCWQWCGMTSSVETVVPSAIWGRASSCFFGIFMRMALRASARSADPRSSSELKSSLGSNFLSLLTKVDMA